MSERPVLRLRRNEERRIRAGHIWVFSNEIDIGVTPLAVVEPGGLVDVEDSRGNFLGSGYANPASLISVRLLTRRRDEPVDEHLVRGRLERALAFRQALFPRLPYYRLVYGEGDGLPGLVVDRFGDTLVVQPTTAGIERLLDGIVEALDEMLHPENVLIRADSPSRTHEGLPLYVRTAVGEVPDFAPVVENGVEFLAPILGGQKTGWFYDHRLNRARLRPYVAGRSVLDLFSYVGGWGVQAAAFGAARVVCADASAQALAGVEENARRNEVSDRVTSRAGDAFALLQQARDDRERFDVVILDPPAFVKRKKDLREGEQAYRRLNRLALDLLPADGILVSASCSFHLGRDELLRAILWAANGARRDVQIIEEGHQGPDHPIHPAIPETAYLKAFFVRVIR